MMDELKIMDGEHTTADLTRNGVQTHLDGPSVVNSHVQDAVDRAATPLESVPLFSESETGEFRSQWIKIQTCFVDEPRGTVKDADKLVSAVMQRLAEGFANERSGLESQWDRGDNVSTEDLRVALQRYRSFFDRLLKL
jgi:hypothetical protein